MKEFRYLSYCTQYSCSGDISTKEIKAACYSKVFHSIFGQEQHSIKYNIIIYKGIKFAVEQHKNNACILSRREIRKHLDCAKRIIDFEYKISEEKRGDYPVYILHIKVDACSTFHKFLLTWVRYMYEFPYNMLVLDVIRLKRKPEFRFTSRTTLMNLVIGCYYDDDLGIHQIPKCQKVVSKLSINSLREMIKNVSKLNDIYHVISKIPYIIDSNVKNSEEKNIHAMDLEYWIDEELYATKREPVYLEVYKKIR